jgi:hypothetical protein
MDLVERYIVLKEVQEIILDSICTEGIHEGWVRAEPLMERINVLRSYEYTHAPKKKRTVGIAPQISSQFEIITGFREELRKHEANVDEQH